MRRLTVNLPDELYEALGKFQGQEGHQSLSYALVAIASEKLLKKSNPKIEHGGYKMLAEVDNWSSRLTASRAGWSEFCDIVHKIEVALGYDPRGEQMGNIINMLQNIKEFDLVDELNEAIAQVNARTSWLKKVYAHSDKPAWRKKARAWLEEADSPWESMTTQQAVCDIETCDF